MTTLLISNCNHVPQGFTKAFMWGAIGETKTKRIDFATIKPWLSALPKGAHASLDIEGYFSARMVACDPLMLDDAALTMQRCLASRPDLVMNFYGYPTMRSVYVPAETQHDGVIAGKQWTFLRRANTMLQSCYMSGDWSDADSSFWYLERMAALNRSLSDVKPSIACLRPRFPECLPLALTLIPKPMLTEWLGYCLDLFDGVWVWNEVRSYANYSRMQPEHATDPVQRQAIIDCRAVFGNRFILDNGELNEKEVELCEIEDAEHLASCLPSTATTPVSRTTKGL